MISMVRRYAPVVLGLAALACFLWYLRSWNLQIGDGEFCCKQTVGENPYDITLSRTPLAHLLYRALFFTLHPILNWWVEDIIALSSCAAGLVFFGTLYLLVRSTVTGSRNRALCLLFPGSSLVLNMFCGHVEFYPWTVALMMVCAYLSWRTLNRDLPPLWPSAALALAAGFHSSGVFYFPALLVLPVYFQSGAGDRSLRREGRTAGFFFALFLATVLLHRLASGRMNGDLFRLDLLQSSPIEYVFAQVPLILFFAVLAAGIWVYRNQVPADRRAYLRPWWQVFWPWFALFAVRAYFGLRAEPLMEHLPPVREPYDHGSYLYMAFSLSHLYDKVMFHLWIAPFGLIGFLYFGFRHFREIVRDGWLHYLFQYALWALIWSTLFYPQLRTRDWDLFVSMGVPLNLFVLYGLVRFGRPALVRPLLAAMLAVHLCISLPVAARNAGVWQGRGYVALVFEPKPVQARVFLRGLIVGHTPLAMQNIRSGSAEIRLVPLERGYDSWDQTLDLEAGRVYTFDPDLPQKNSGNE